MRGQTPESGPDFLGIGAMRSGSTWLHRNLRAHPQLWLPPIKELHYFDCQAGSARLNKFSRAHLRRRLRAYRHPRAWGRAPLRWDADYFLRRRSDAWYCSLFRPAPGQLAGEITPRYSILEPAGVARVHALLPRLRLVFVMRNPIERSWSQVAKGALDELGGAARGLPMDEWAQRLRSEGVRARSDYPAILERWTACFGAGRIFLAFFEEIDEAPRALLARLFAFLGVDPPDEDWYGAERVDARANPSPGAGIAMPDPIRRLLAAEYRDVLRELHERLGGPASRWYRESLRALGSGS
jgi:hypothetical protein